ncbi:hypothetical protein Tco_0481740, partial [Tanacetum coccineum]
MSNYQGLNSAVNKEEPVRRGPEAGARDPPSDSQVTHPDANMAFDLRPTEDVLPWPGGANIAFDLVPDLQCLLHTWCEYGIRLSIVLATPLTYVLYLEILTWTKERISAALVIGTCRVDKGSAAHDVSHCEVNFQMQ